MNDGTERWQQHRRGCPFEHIGPHNPRGDAWSWQTARPSDPQRGNYSGQRCSACLHLALDAVQGPGSAEMPRYRQLSPECQFSFVEGARCGDASDFLSTPLCGKHLNAWLHQLVGVVNDMRRHAGLPTWTLHEIHWHMFRHGAYVMMALEGASDSECGQKLTMARATMCYYRAHISRFIGVSLEHHSLSQLAVTAVHDAGVARLATELRSAMPQLSVAESAALTLQLQSLLAYLRLSPQAFKNMRACFRQVSGTLAALALLFSLSHASLCNMCAPLFSHYPMPCNVTGRAVQRRLSWRATSAFATTDARSLTVGRCLGWDAARFACVNG